MKQLLITILMSTYLFSSEMKVADLANYLKNNVDNGDHPALEYLEKHVRRLRFNGELYRFKSRFHENEIDADQIFGCIKNKCSIMYFHNDRLQVDLSYLFKRYFSLNADESRGTEYIRGRFNPNMSKRRKDKICQNFLGKSWYVVEGSENVLYIERQHSGDGDYTIDGLSCVYVK